MLPSVSFWPLLIIESVARVSQHVLFTHELLVNYISRYNAEGKLDCFNCKAGFFSQIIHSNVYKRKQLQSTFLGKKSTPLWGIFNNYNEKLSVPRVQTAALIES